MQDLKTHQRINQQAGPSDQLEFEHDSEFAQQDFLNSDSFLNQTPSEQQSQQQQQQHQVIIPQPTYQTNIQKAQQARARNIQIRKQQQGMQTLSGKTGTRYLAQASKKIAKPQRPSINKTAPVSPQQHQTSATQIKIQNPNLTLKQTQDALEHKATKHRQWMPSYRIISLQSPELLSVAESKAKKYKISFRYFDGAKQHAATVRFGRRDTRDRVDGISPEYALLRTTQIRDPKNPFHPNYWSLWLLNNPRADTIQKAHADFREQHKLM